MLGEIKVVVSLDSAEKKKRKEYIPRVATEEIYEQEEIEHEYVCRGNEGLDEDDADVGADDRKHMKCHRLSCKH